MNTLNPKYYNLSFSHVYVEKDIINDAYTKSILEKIKPSQIIYIDHYKDVFCRSNQNPSLQHLSQALILAKKNGRKVYEGARVCQSFDNEFFYYTSCVMNCIYDCEYCYLKGMYQSGFMVVFVNTEDIFDEIRQILSKHSAYICVSYDTDLLALENLLGLVHKWCEFVDEVNEVSENKLTIEIRTKCGNIASIKDIKANDHVIFAYTMSPEYIVKNFEHGTSSMKARIDAAAELLKLSFKARLCFDPMLYSKEWKSHYSEMLSEIVKKLDFNQIYDISIGSFRISKDYLKQMRKNMPYSSVTQFPFENTKGVYHYPDELQKEMEDFLKAKISEHYPKEKIFMWKE